MKLLRSFNNRRGSFWLGLLIAALLVSGPLQGRDQVHSVFGKITAIDIAGRVIEVDGFRYALAAQIAIRGESEQAARIADLEVGQYVQFEIDGGSAKHVRILDEEQDGVPPLFIQAE